MQSTDIESRVVRVETKEEEHHKDVMRRLSVIEEQQRNTMEEVSRLISISENTVSSVARLAKQASDHALQPAHPGIDNRVVVLETKMNWLMAGLGFSGSMGGASIGVIIYNILSGSGM